MSEGDVKIKRPNRAVKTFLMFVHVAHRPCVTLSFGLIFSMAEGWMLGFIVFSWVLYVINGAVTDMARREQHQRQIEGQINVAPGIVINEDQARRIFEIFHEGKAQPPTGLN